ncbi:MAG TPA: YdeI/OmpD-associated family protein [Cyclobacteriaceae bacterium]|nr:YdeI/OmpD-associated family protein [Cyclobacteriaceae bacterium]
MAKKSATNPKVDWFFDKDTQWQNEYTKLRAIALESGLTEVLKWGCPCYSLDKANVVLIHGFKEYCAYLFFKGAIMSDPKGILIQQTENVQSARQVRFTSASQITKMKSTLKAYIKEAIDVEASGQKVEFKKTAEFNMPEEFQKKLDKNRALETAFYALTPGRQRGYLLYFSSARKAETREQRIEKYTKQILAGKGLED